MFPGVVVMLTDGGEKDEEKRGTKKARKRSEVYFIVKKPAMI